MSEVVYVVRAPIGYAILTSIMVGLYVSKFATGLSAIECRMVVFASASVVASVCLAIRLFCQHAASPRQVRKLASKIHEEVDRLKKSGCTKFRLRKGDARFACILIAKKGDVAFIHYVTWGKHFDDEPARWFEIGLSGVVSRCSADSSWLRGPLIPRLVDLWNVLKKCEPCLSKEEARREDR